MDLAAKTGERVLQLRSKMAATGADLLAVAPGPNMQWLLGFSPHPDERPCLLLITANEWAFLTPALNADGLRSQCNVPLFSWDDATGAGAALTAAIGALNAHNLKNVILDETMRADFALLLLEQFDKPVHHFTGATLGALRMHKDADEYTALKKNALIADRALYAGLNKLSVGMTEAELVGHIKQGFTDQETSILFGIAATGGNGAFPHHQAGARAIQANEPVLIDLGGVFEGYPSDMTRMAMIGQPSETYQKIHSVVEKAVQAALAAARPGVLAKDVDAAARNVISDAGYADYFVHRTGHGLGLEIHEGPFISASSETVLQSGMVFSIEPGIYLPDQFGIRLEDIVILRDDGPEILSALPRDLIVLDQNLHGGQPRSEGR